MRVGVVVRMEADTDIDEKFAEVRAMGMESCQLVCWERKIINDEKGFWRQPKNTGLLSVHSGVDGADGKSGIFMMVS